MPVDKVLLESSQKKTLTQNLNWEEIWEASVGGKGSGTGGKERGCGHEQGVAVGTWAPPSEAPWEI